MAGTGRLRVEKHALLEFSLFANIEAGGFLLRSVSPFDEPGWSIIPHHAGPIVAFHSF